ncbi:MAG: V-type ATP synthase subunit I, partial [Oscillospiraceae bacterium]|nr:V-type ATP synthase subunit I [Oscillospiraceae bacterium]
KLYFDQVAQNIETENAKGKLYGSETAFALNGWVPLPEVQTLETILNRHVCAYELTDPAEGDIVPVKFRNNKLTEPFNMVTEIFSYPRYTSLDPNPLIMPFYIIFFGIMFNDFGYGLILIIASLIVRHKMPRLRGTLKYMTGLMLMCGITTCAAGLITGSFFGNSADIIGGFVGRKIKIYPLFNPMTNVTTMLIASLGIGVIHILFGMGVKAYLLIRGGKPLDALMDVGSWWLLFAGIALGAFGITWFAAIAGVIALVFTQGRKSPTSLGKILGGFASLFKVILYFGDVLSYLRLMAIMLTCGVMAQAINTFGAIPGPTVFIPVFVVGHLLNIGINLIFAYVHAARLQYPEFFGRFCENGGKPFRPLSIKTNYVDID